MATKRKLPGIIQPMAADHVIADSNEHPALKMAKELDVCTTPPRVPKGSPADAFRQSQIIKSPNYQINQFTFSNPLSLRRLYISLLIFNQCQF